MRNLGFSHRRCVPGAADAVGDGHESFFAEPFLPEGLCPLISSSLQLSKQSALSWFSRKLSLKGQQLVGGGSVVPQPDPLQGAAKGPSLPSRLSALGSSALPFPLTASWEVGVVPGCSLEEEGSGG